MSEHIKSGAEVLPPRPKTAREKAAAFAALSEEEKRATRCCFTGHRPEGLKRPVDDLKVDLENEIVKAIQDGYNTFITGMAPGIDLWAGCIVLRLKDRFPDIKLIAAVPFPEFRERWNDEWKAKYDRVLAGADCVQIISHDSSPSVYQARNIWMVDHSSKVIAVYNGKASGTRNTIRYAKEQKVQIKYINT